MHLENEARRGKLATEVYPDLLVRLAETVSLVHREIAESQDQLDRLDQPAHRVRLVKSDHVVIVDHKDSADL